MAEGLYGETETRQVLIPDTKAWHGYIRGLHRDNHSVQRPPTQGIKFPVVVEEETGEGWCGTSKVRVTVVEEAHTAELPQYQFQFDGAQYVPAEK